MMYQMWLVTEKQRYNSFSTREGGCSAKKYKKVWKANCTPDCALMAYDV